MNSTINISTKIPIELEKILTNISIIEKKEKSYYIKTALEKFLEEKLENMSNYDEAKNAYIKFNSWDKKTFSLENTFKNI